MIKCGDGKTQLSGSLLDLLQDFVNIVCSMRSALTDKLPEEEADKLIAFAGELAYASLREDNTREAELVLEIIKLIEKG